MQELKLKFNHSELEALGKILVVFFQQNPLPVLKENILLYGCAAILQEIYEQAAKKASRAKNIGAETVFTLTISQALIFICCLQDGCFDFVGKDTYEENFLQQLRDTIIKKYI